jgi:hypothetical protein
MRVLFLRRTTLPAASTDRLMLLAMLSCSEQDPHQVVFPANRCCMVDVAE